MIAAIVVMAAVPCQAEVYRYVGHNGVVTLTDRPETIPKDLRKSARVVNSVSDGYTAPASPGGLLVNSTPWVKPLSEVAITRKGAWGGLWEWLSTPTGLIVIGCVITLIVPALVFYLIKNNALRLAVIVIVLSAAYLGLFSYHLKWKLDRGEQVIEAIEKAYRAMGQENAAINGVIKNSP